MLRVRSRTGRSTATAFEADQGQNTMFEEFFRLKENPFSLAPNPRFLFQSREHAETLAHLRYWIENAEGFVLITGEVGTGKTTAIYDLLAQLPTTWSVAMLTHSTLSEMELLEEICRRFHIEIPAERTKPRLLGQIESFLNACRARGHGALLIIDEGQNLDPSRLEEVRLLSNMERLDGKLLQIALVGQPELEAMLRTPELRQLRQRIGIKYRLGPLSRRETSDYIHHRLEVAGAADPEAIFPPDTCAEVFRVTGGIPREINIVSSQSLINAFVDEAEQVRPSHVESVLSDFSFESIGSGRGAGSLDAPRGIERRPQGRAVSEARDLPDTREATDDDDADRGAHAAPDRDRAAEAVDVSGPTRDAPQREAAPSTEQRIAMQHDRTAPAGEDRDGADAPPEPRRPRPPARRWSEAPRPRLGVVGGGPAAAAAERLEPDGEPSDEDAATEHTPAAARAPAAPAASTAPAAPASRRLPHLMGPPPSSHRRPARWPWILITLLLVAAAVWFLRGAAIREWLGVEAFPDGDRGHEVVRQAGTGLAVGLPAPAGASDRHGDAEATVTGTTPASGPAVDAGGSESDAGGSESDAGGSESDAGGSESDAATTAGSGERGDGRADDPSG
ncbi:MAG: AAA family ATPase, partial [Candidatus Eiseniibacteriota bacterium]